MNITDVKIQNVPFTIRSINRYELKNIMKEFAEDIEQEDALLKLCVLKTPEDFDLEYCPAGIVEALIKYILGFSGFGDEESQLHMLEEARKQAREYERTFDLMIMFALGENDLEKLESLDTDQWMLRVAMSERVLIELYGIAPEVIQAFISGDAAQVEQVAEQQKPRTKEEELILKMKQAMDSQGIPFPGGRG